ncbi:Mitogen-activated protein kinase 4 [Manis javanica]|nr:Mitogen-activated protein kinase 4 [Manis javanica]
MHIQRSLATGVYSRTLKKWSFKRKRKMIWEKFHDQLVKEKSGRKRTGYHLHGWHFEGRLGIVVQEKTTSSLVSLREEHSESFHSAELRYLHMEHASAVLRAGFLILKPTGLAVSKERRE